MNFYKSLISLFFLESTLKVATTRCSHNNAGTLREVFVASMLSQAHTIQAAKKGDLLVDEKYTLEVGGKNKKYKQIKDIANSFVVADDTEVGSGNRVPLWLFGFLY